MSLHGRCFAFEADFVDNLRCLPMAVRRKLDLVGVKLKLVHWSGLEPEERQRLLAWPDDKASLDALRQWLLARSAALPQGPALPLPPAQWEPWQQGEQMPAILLASYQQLGLTPAAEQWRKLDELQRFALVKLSHPGHEHRNLPRALEEFGLVTLAPSLPESGSPHEDKSRGR
ncbi:nitrate reductase associated protein [Synechococcus sp. CS-1328]|uniref:nitrate reductase associated protein n=1 Tax=Synechococcus sp. CS-1328 TaxID=2847976 RepID=UPI00223C23C7|nr:nitrate reductase associated protein [Synechococcus sp. CS-1328]MCT0225346.1 nitrate reductase associated protein [Synechococcus sp. CS-1328]